MGAGAGAAATAGAAAAAGETVVAATTPPAAGTLLLVFLLVTMIDVKSMLEMVVASCPGGRNKDCALPERYIKIRPFLFWMKLHQRWTRRVINWFKRPFKT